MSELTRVQPTRLSDVIMQQLEGRIVDGTYAVGERLPSERELARQLDVSRPSLREAIQKLEAKGLVTRRHGGGTFVSGALHQKVADPLFTLLAKNPEAHYDLLEFRHALEGVSSFFAAMRGTDADRARIQEAFDAATEAADIGPKEQAQALMRFYVAITEASNNVVLLHLVRGMQDILMENMRQNLEVLNRRVEIRAQLHKHRSLIVAEIMAGQPERARDACHQHLAYIEATLLQLNRDHQRLERSGRRSEQ